MACATPPPAPPGPGAGARPTPESALVAAHRALARHHLDKALGHALTACRLAMGELRAATGLDLYDGRRAPMGILATARRLELALARVEAGVHAMHDEEAAGWLRQAHHFVRRLEALSRRRG